MKKEIILGIDLGVNCGVVASNGYTTLEDISFYLEDLKKTKDLSRIKNSQWNTIDSYINMAASKILNWRKKFQATKIALEDLRFTQLDIKRIFLLKLKQKIFEKNKALFHLVNPCNTSLTCFNCGYCDELNRFSFEFINPNRDFFCQRCGEEDEGGDRNAARVIAIKCAIELARNLKQKKTRLGELDFYHYTRIQRWISIKGH